MPLIKDDEDKIVDEYFSFIYSENSSDCDESVEGSRKVTNSAGNGPMITNYTDDDDDDGRKMTGDSVTVDHLASVNAEEQSKEDQMLNVDALLDDHFSFLQEEDSMTEEYFSFDYQDGINKEGDYENVSLPQKRSVRDEPIYSNVGARPKLKNQIDGLDSNSNEPLYENIRQFGHRQSFELKTKWQNKTENLEFDRGNNQLTSDSSEKLQFNFDLQPKDLSNHDIDQHKTNTEIIKIHAAISPHLRIKNTTSVYLNSSMTDECKNEIKFLIPSLPPVNYYSESPLTHDLVNPEEREVFSDHCLATSWTTPSKSLPCQGPDIKLNDCYETSSPVPDAKLPNWIESSQNDDEEMFNCSSPCEITSNRSSSTRSNFHEIDANVEEHTNTIEEMLSDSSSVHDLERLKNLDLELIKLENIEETGHWSSIEQTKLHEGNDRDSTIEWTRKEFGDDEIIDETNGTGRADALEIMLTDEGGAAAVSMDHSVPTIGTKCEFSAETETMIELCECDLINNKRDESDDRFNISRQSAFDEGADGDICGPEPYSHSPSSGSNSGRDPSLPLDTSIVRKSMRKMRHIRLSGKRHKNRSKHNAEANVSTEIRDSRDSVQDARLELSSVRSVTLLPSLLAALAPSDEGPPRETLPSPQQHALTTNSYERLRFHIERSSNSVPIEGHSWFIPTAQREDSTTSTSSIPSTRNDEGVAGTSRESHVNSARTPESSSFTSPIPSSIRRCSTTIRTSSITPLISENRSLNPPPNTTDTLSDRSSSNLSQSVSTNSRTRNPEIAATSPVRSVSTLGRRNTRRTSQIGFQFPPRRLWPHRHSGLLASLPVTLNIFNISRFAVLGAHFGWLFPIQWLILSTVIGLPLMTFQAALGQATGGSVIDMWIISPIFQGVGYGLLFIEMLLGIYCCIPIAWLFSYFRDSFNMRTFQCQSLADCDSNENLTQQINSVTDYFRSTLLQNSEESEFSSFVDLIGSLKFDLSFNLAFIWVITFLALSRGKRSYGKICYPMSLLPLGAFFALCFYLIHWTNSTLDDGQLLLSKFIDRQSWLVASREAFLVWGLHAAVTQQMAAGHKKNHPLWSDTSCQTIITALGLGLSSFCGLLCSSVLDERKLVYLPSSFETSLSRDFVIERSNLPNTQRLEPSYHNFYVGIKIVNENIIRLDHTAKVSHSGYNCIRFLTELFPALIFAKKDHIPSVWPPIFYLSLLLFGLAYQLAIWHTVVQGIMRIHRRLASWETFIAFCLCLLGFVTSLFMATGAGIHIIYFLDFAIGGLWWIMILQLIMVFAILFVRGKPFSAKDLATVLLGKGCSTAWLTSPVAFSWTIMIPVGLLVLSISFFKSGNYREVFAWSSSYWSTWTCQLASTMQLFPLLVVPLVGLIQTCRYLADPRQDLFERIQHLYRPPPRDEDQEEEPIEFSVYDLRRTQEARGMASSETDAPLPYSDPPPKYTPPPSYSTATGSGLSKLFNRSFRLLRNTVRNDTEVRLDASSDRPYIPPPDYLTRQSPNSPPHYATLDPLRMHRAMRDFFTGKPSSVVQLHLPSQLRRRQASCGYCGIAFHVAPRSTAEEGQRSQSRGDEESNSGSNSDCESYSSCNGSCTTTNSEKSSAVERESEDGARDIVVVGTSACANPYCPGAEQPPSFVLSDMPGEASSLSRTLRSSIRTSARRLAQVFSGPSRQNQNPPVLVSHISGNSTNPNQSEA